MKKDFSKITDEERKAIWEWSLDSDKIKNAMWGKIANVKAKKEASLLIGMFDKYNSNVKEGTVLYRGKGVNQSEWDKTYKNIAVGMDYSPDEKAIISFSKKIETAYSFAYASEHKYKIIIKTLSHGNDMFDISNMAADPSEEETIFSKNLWYTVKKVEKKEEGGFIWLLIELEKQ